MRRETGGWRRGKKREERKRKERKERGGEERKGVEKMIEKEEKREREWMKKT